MIEIGIAGAAGRMGRELIAAVDRSAELKLTLALEAPDQPCLGADSGLLATGTANHIPFCVEPGEHNCQVLIDFSLPAGLAGHIDWCRERGWGLVVGTTGLEPKLKKQLHEASTEIPVLQSANMSVGINLMQRLARIVSTALGEEWDTEVIEAHHRHKLDAPSGTALALGEAVAAGRGRTLDELAVYSRDNTTGARNSGSIGFAVIRGGDLTGDHTVLFASSGERLELTHRTSSRSAFVHGALRAAHWLAGRAAGFYSMADVLDDAAADSVKD